MRKGHKKFTSVKGWANNKRPPLFQRAMADEVGVVGFESNYPHL